MRAVFLIAFIIAALIPAFASAEDRALDLKALLEEARANNPELKSMRETVQAGKSRAAAEGSLEDPNVRVEMEDLPMGHPLTNGPGNTMLTRYTVSQAFPFPGKRALKKRIAEKGTASSASALAAKELEVASMVKEGYFEFAFLNESSRIISGIKDLLAAASAAAETKYSTGQVPQQDIIKLNLEGTVLAKELLNIEAEKEIASQRLKRLLGRQQDSVLEGTPRLPKQKIGFDTKELLEKAVEANPEIAMLRSDAESEELGAALAKKNYYPDFMVGFAPIQRDGRFDTYDLMFQVNIPIWRGKYNGLADEAKAKGRSARLRLENERAQKTFEVRSAAAMVEASAKARELFETSLLPQADLSYESVLNNYQIGKTELITLLDTERELKRTRIEYLNTLLEYYRRIASLELASGVELMNFVNDNFAEAIKDGK